MCARMTSASGSVELVRRTVEGDVIFDFNVVFPRGGKVCSGWDDGLLLCLCTLGSRLAGYAESYWNVLEVGSGRGANGARWSWVPLWGGGLQQGCSGLPFVGRYRGR